MVVMELVQKLKHLGTSISKNKIRVLGRPQINC